MFELGRALRRTARASPPTRATISVSVSPGIAQPVFPVSAIVQFHGGGAPQSRRRLVAVCLCLLRAMLVVPLMAASVRSSRAADQNVASALVAPKYILFLTADGFRTDYIERFAPPHLSE